MQDLIHNVDEKGLAKGQVTHSPTQQFIIESWNLVAVMICSKIYPSVVPRKPL